MTRANSGVGSFLTRIAPVLGSLGFLALWEGSVRLFNIPSYELTKPSTAVRIVAAQPGFFWRNAWPTITEAGLGLLLALAVSIFLGALMAESRFLERAFAPLVVLLQVVPLVAYATTLVVWLGVGLRPIAVVAAVVCVAPLLVNVVAGLRSADPAAVELLRSVDASRWEVLVKLRMPSALPFLFAGLRTAVGLALVGAMLGEWFAVVQDGLGFWIRRAGAEGLTRRPLLWGFVLVAAAIGVVGVLLVAALERVVMRGRRRDG